MILEFMSTWLAKVVTIIICSFVHRVGRGLAVLCIDRRLVVCDDLKLRSGVRVTDVAGGVITISPTHLIRSGRVAIGLSQFGASFLCELKEKLRFVCGSLFAMRYRSRLL
jgi:hypothetical protein